MHNMSDHNYRPSGYGVCQACHSHDLNCCDGKGGPFKLQYTGLTIYRTEDGYCAKNGPDYAADNEPTIEDAKASIDDYWESNKNA